MSIYSRPLTWTTPALNGQVDAIWRYFW